MRNPTPDLGLARVFAVLVLLTACGGDLSQTSAPPGEGVGGAVGATQLAIGHTFCALLEDGTAACWGFNDQGQLGIGTSDMNAHSTPERVQGLMGATALRQGWNTTCAIVAQGAVKCWGFGAQGQLGNGTATDGYFSPVPVDVMGLHGVTDLALDESGEYACAVMADGTVSCWGNNAGNLGFDSPMCGPYAVSIGDNETQETTQPCQTTPTAVPGVSGVQHIAIGNLELCAWADGGAVTCWGQTGLAGTLSAYAAPAPMPNLGSVESVVVGSSHACALLADGTVQCWGDNSMGQLGLGTSGPSSSAIPVAVPGMTQVSALHVDGDENCVIHDGGQIACWGDANELLGLPSVQGNQELYVESPQPVATVTDAVEIGTDFDVGCYRDTSDAVHCWQADPSTFNDAQTTPLVFNLVPL